MDLYTKKIIELAAKIPFSERLLNPDVSTTKRTPICGSRITIDMNISNGKISKFGQNVSKEKGEISVSVKKAKGTKCSRCWKIVKEIKDNKCLRCSKIK